MPATYVNRFSYPGAHTTQTSPAWRWDGTDDATFASFVEAESDGYVGDVNVDRSSGTPVLRWQYYQAWDGQPKGVFGELELTSGMFVNPRYQPPYGSPDTLGQRPGAVDPADGYWESDQYGRPYDLNDLLAPGTAPA